MILETISKDKSIKAKQKVEMISQWLIDKTLPIDELIDFAEKAKEVDKANCIEAIELTTKKVPTIADESTWILVTNTLTEQAPRIKWESAKIIGNTVHLFPENLNKVIAPLLINAKHEGTVVRWSAAYALGEILKLETKYNKTLLPKIEALSEKERNNGVKKKYTDALKEIKI
jgi:hypothetical protein